ncbi:MAG: 2-oxo acid dehydrogenase subunit E2 [Blastocatellia bacterium]|nr:2-oxo acid dehydrogenase subunit E2 [Blastocatellia bacterium]
MAEGTLVKWLKKVGDTVKRDEPLFEISTDKVDAEIPSPAEGVLLEILVGEGQTVPINTVVARIGAAGSLPTPPPIEKVTSPPPPQPQVSKTTDEKVATASVAAQPISQPTATSVEELRRIKSSPLVRKIAREHNIDISKIRGTGLSGRVTKYDILSYIESSRQAAAVSPAEPAPPQVAAAAGVAATTPTPVTPAPPYPTTTPAPIPPPAVVIPAFKPGENVVIEPMSPMRKKIAERMVASKHISAHVASIFEIDMTRVMKLKEEYRETFLKRHGVRLTVTPFLVKAAAETLLSWPMMNASIDGDNIVYKKDINIGVAVALDWGLIVPVIKNADEKNLIGIAKAVNDLGTRARNKQLKPEEVQGGTFTITNPGIFGSLFGTPIINQPQVAIMGVGTIEKRLTVMADDTIAIRQKAYFSIVFDHRLIDGAVADQFMSAFKKRIENFSAEELS